MCHCGVSTVLPLRHESLASIDSYRQLSTNIDRVPAVGRGKHISLSLTAVDTMLLFTSLFISLTFVLFFFLFLPFWPGASRSAVGWCTALQTRRSRFRFPMESLEFFIDIILRPHYGSGVDSASDRNEYEEYFLGVKAAGEYGWQPCHHVPIVLKSWILNLLEPSGPVQGFLYFFFFMFLARLPSWTPYSRTGYWGRHLVVRSWMLAFVLLGVWTGSFASASLSSPCCSFIWPCAFWTARYRNRMHGGSAMLALL